MSLWTVSCDYFATGEGRTQMVIVCYADNEAAALDIFEARFGGWYTIGATALEGLQSHPLISKYIADEIERGTNRANIVFSSSLHLNFS